MKEGKIMDNKTNPILALNTLEDVINENHNILFSSSATIKEYKIIIDNNKLFMEDLLFHQECYQSQNKILKFIYIFITLLINSLLILSLFLMPAFSLLYMIAIYIETKNLIRLIKKEDYHIDTQVEIKIKNLIGRIQHQNYIAQTRLQKLGIDKDQFAINYQDQSSDYPMPQIMPEYNAPKLVRTRNKS